jgi:hypothetical protein
MIVISNSKFTAAEFSQWRNYCEKKSVKIPSHEKIEEIEVRLKKTRNYAYSPTEINKIIEQNIEQLIEKGESNMNLTYIRTQIETQFKVAQSVLDKNQGSSEAQEIYDKLKSNLEKINELQKKKYEEQNKNNTAQNFNVRAQKLQIEEDRKRSELIKKKMKQNRGFDPFSTLACKPKILWNTDKNDRNQDDPELEDNKGEILKASADGRPTKRFKVEFKTDFEKALARKERILDTVKTIDLGIDHLISVDPTDFSKYPPFSKKPKLEGMHPVLKAKLEAKQKADLGKEKRKVISLEEYYDQVK